MSESSASSRESSPSPYESSPSAYEKSVTSVIERAEAGEGLSLADDDELKACPEAYELVGFMPRKRILRAMATYIVAKMEEQGVKKEDIEAKRQKWHADLDAWEHEAIFPDVTYAEIQSAAKQIEKELKVLIPMNDGGVLGHGGDFHLCVR